MTSDFLRALRVLRMVHEFHKEGYQLMRISPGLAPSGLHWRCIITPRSNILERNGGLWKNWDFQTAKYSSWQSNHYFNWTDAERDNVKTLVEKFKARYPDIVQASKGLDWEYVGWYVTMLGYAERESLPIAYADGLRPKDTRFITLSGGEIELLMPPPGDAVGERGV